MLKAIFQHSNINFLSPSDHVIFLLLQKIFTIHKNVCCDFLKISEHFLNIYEDFLKFVPRQTFPNISEHFPKINEDNQRRLKINKEDPNMFQSWPTNFSVVQGTMLLNVIKNDIFTCIILFLWICYHSLYHLIIFI